MSITSLPSQTPTLSASTPVAPKKPETPAAKTLETLPAEAVEIKKDAFNGALRGGLTAAAAVAIPGLAYVAKSSGGIEKLFSLYIAGGGTAAAAVTGAAAGAVASQVTDSPWKGALVGAVTGAALGAGALGALGRSLNGAATGAAIGAVGGLIGGVAGSYASEKK